MREVLETTKYVAEKSRLVQIDKQALTRFVRKLLGDEIRVPPWDPCYHFCDGTEETVSYLLVLDSLNFCFWPPPGKAKWEIEYKSEKLSGYYAIAASLKKVFESGIPVTSSAYLAGLTSDELNRILGGRGELQLMGPRLQILNELGQVLLKDYDGKAHRLVEAADNSAAKLARLLAEKFSSFRDIAEYRGHEVFFYKRAQIFAADLHGAFNGKKWGRFGYMDGLTAFADYKLPQVLRHSGIIRYNGSLAKKVDQQVLLEPGSLEEIEIRANTIWAVELIRQELERMGKVLRAFEIDWILWNLGQDDAFRERPYHRTISICY
ncbi:MAG: queuosine salvage family protein [Deltaproteobacteria bacterium]|nr:queuosine salvage family protein [Deltaproteobacteria bacterium]